MLYLYHIGALNWLYYIAEWTWIFCKSWYGNLIWIIWLIINIVIFTINMFYPIIMTIKALSEGKRYIQLRWNPILVFIIQPLMFIFILWIGSLFY